MTGCRRLATSLRSTPTASPVGHVNEARRASVSRYLRRIGPSPRRAHDAPSTWRNRMNLSRCMSRYGLIEVQSGMCVNPENLQGRQIFRLTGAFPSRSPGYDKGQSRTPAQNPRPRPLSLPPLYTPCNHEYPLRRRDVMLIPKTMGCSGTGRVQIPPPCQDMCFDSVPLVSPDTFHKTRSSFRS